MFNCEHCWDNPCTCGHEWKDRSLKYLYEQRDMIDRVINEKKSMKTPLNAPVQYKHPFLLNPDMYADVLWKELDWKRIDTTPRYEYYHAVDGLDYTL
jgi:hypothetical protein